MGEGAKGSSTRSAHPRDINQPGERSSESFTCGSTGVMMSRSMNRRSVETEHPGLLSLQTDCRES